VSWSAAAFWLCLIGGPSAIWYGTRRKVNRRRRDVLPAPSARCSRQADIGNWS